MDKPIVFALIVIVSSGVAYYLWQEREAESILAGNAQVKKSVSPLKNLNDELEKQVQYPLPETVKPRPQVAPQAQLKEPQAEAFILPELDTSDLAIQGAVAEAAEYSGPLDRLIFSNIIRHLVVTIDNLTEKKLPRKFAFTKKPDSSFVIDKTETDTEFYLNEDNYKRYQPYMDILDKIENQQLVSIYVRYYPLFQEAYDELGYSNRYFNDRVVEIIDHLLKAPVVSERIKLIQPKVYFHYANPDLEKLSAGQKLLIRIGPANAGNIRQRLQQLRVILTTFKP